MKARTESTPHPNAPLWTAAQALGIVLTAALLAGLWLRPQTTLRVLWNGVIPLLPATFLIHPGLWRNICPLATLATLPGGSAASRRPSPAALARVIAAGIVLFAVLVPARRFHFNADGHMLALTILAVAVVAVASGLPFDRKAGFCNAVCPVPPAPPVRPGASGRRLRLLVLTRRRTGTRRQRGDSA